MGWLIGYTISSMVGAFIVVRLFEYAFSGLTGWVGNVVKASIFSGTWAAITAGLGMRGVNKGVHSLRDGAKGVSNRLDPPVK